MGKLDRMNIVTMVMHKTDRQTADRRQTQGARQTNRETYGRTDTHRQTNSLQRWSSTQDRSKDEEDIQQKPSYRWTILQSCASHFLALQEMGW